MREGQPIYSIPARRPDFMRSKLVPCPHRVNCPPRGPSSTTTSAVGGVSARLFLLLRSIAETLVASWRIGQLTIEHRSVPDAAFHESRPRWNPGPHVDLFRQQPPQIRVVPAQVVTRTVSMGANACAKAFRLGDQLLLCQGFQIFVQAITFPKPGRRLDRCATICGPILVAGYRTFGTAGKGSRAAVRPLFRTTVTLDELVYLAEQAGLCEVKVLAPAVTGYYQPILSATRT